MEYLLVRYDRQRKVYINGTHNGMTNSVIELEPGRYEVTLSPPPNFEPDRQIVDLAGTLVLDPHEIRFIRVSGSS